MGQGKETLPGTKATSSCLLGTPKMPWGGSHCPDWSIAMQGSLLQAHRADKMRLDADAPARTEQRQLKMWAEIWEQAERAPSWVVRSELPLLTGM